MTKGQLKDFLLNDLRIGNVTEKDIDVYMKTHPVLADKDVLTSNDLKLAFENAFNEAKERIFLEQAERGDMTQYGNKQQQRIMKESGAFGWN